MLLWGIAIEMLCVMGAIALTLAGHLDSLRFLAIEWPLRIVVLECNSSNWHRIPIW